jgi:hypothetical protein
MRFKAKEDNGMAKVTVYLKSGASFTVNVEKLTVKPWTDISWADAEKGDVMLAVRIDDISAIVEHL